MAYALNLHAHDVEQTGLFARLSKSFADHREYIATYKTLNALTDRQLSDFGVTRQSIGEIAWASVYGD
ncbi:MAG TPA: DUF1127 domain-containing protein [Amaricoccus sp.]|uniref:DUF1127 domain-containing protein n=1 Tax=Amaricoccus sp. TaxID=1872485 RepID=UPI002CF5D50D|nr:DUF1127 domain-containing protein [Amaricoccus sp.]HMQ92221.1 DUF1127 domain-containing protein [Amaricoccus sp.]HMR12198.1 DUF1127 domain-containing protein [Arachnia sp.]HMR51677.1 DUF1127 domain-containing protein [Amaricoccus sp.]HMT98387.1 DUF1127 domain-containing protein [Amaricoccus sp.]